MSAYEKFIPENIAPKDVKQIDVYNKKGYRIGKIELGKLAFPNNSGEKLYSFGALSDVHIPRETATEDFQRALIYLNKNADIKFTCICGDLTDNGKPEELSLYKSIVDNYSKYTPVYAIAGNHESVTSHVVTNDVISPYTKCPLYYSFTYGSDVFIMCGEYAWGNDYLFADGELQWLYEILEKNRNKRCFVFFHVFPWDDCGNAQGIYKSDLFTGTQGSVFQSLMQHYKNVTLFHGHSHLKFYLQEIDDKANYSKALGFRSVHIPSLSVPRDADIYDTNNDGLLYVQIVADSEGYVVDVYENGIHLRGRDFKNEKFLPIASYWLDTTLQTIPEKTYTDSTGTIKTTKEG